MITLAHSKPVFFILMLTLISCLTGCAVRPWTKTEKALLVTSTLATAADCYTQERLMDRGGSEMNPLIGEHPSDTKFIAFMASSQALAVILSHYIPWLRKPLLGLKTVVNGGLAIHNDRAGR